MALSTAKSRPLADRLVCYYLLPIEANNQNNNTMNIEKIQQLVARKNEEIERTAMYEASELITKILSWKNDIKEIEQSIKDAQDQLKSLEAQTIDVKEVL